MANGSTLYASWCVSNAMSLSVSRQDLSGEGAQVTATHTHQVSSAAFGIKACRSEGAAQRLARDGGWKKYCQFCDKTRRAVQQLMSYIMEPPTPKFNVGRHVLGPPLRMEEILPVNIEIGGAGVGCVSRLGDILSCSLNLRCCKKLAIFLPPTAFETRV